MKNYKKNDPIVISEGNSKIGKIPNVSLPPSASCNNDLPCKKDGCYSEKALRRFESVRLARSHNWRVWKKEPNRYFKDIEDFLQAEEPAYFRFHVDGDIPSQDYLNRMIKLARNHKETRFLAFTKKFQLDFSNCPENLIIIPSAWPKMNLPKSLWVHNLAWMQDGREDRNQRAYFECHKHCDECYACWHIDRIGRDVLFAKH